MKLAATSASMIVLAPALHAGVIVNGGFEDPLETTWTRSGVVGRSSMNAIGYAPSEGTFGILFNGGNQSPNGELSQSFNTNAGAMYRLVFDFGKFQFGAGTASLLVSITSMTDALLFAQSVSDTTGEINSKIHATYIFEFTADSTLATLSFSDISIGTNEFDAALDNVRVILIPSPAPAALLTLTGLAATAIRRR